MTPVATMEKQEQISVHDLVADQDLTANDVRTIFDLAGRVKASPASYARALAGKQLAMIFEKPSLRTRVTFEVGMTSMGGFAIYLDHSKPRLGERESIKDVARNLDRWVDGIVARTFAHQSVVELAENASIPVVNALTDLLHPCQALGDFFTLTEKFGSLKGLKLAGAKLGVTVQVATPSGFEPKGDMVNQAKALARTTGAKVQLVRDPLEAVAGAQAVYTDVWASMGQEYAAHLRTQVFAPYQVTENLMQAAAPDAVFLHCLPAHRGLEVTDAVIDSSRSHVYDQAENRLHVQKALLLLLMQSN
jgi:ornithine carbamoyltransferase